MNTPFKILLLLALAAFTLQSCTDDEELEMEVIVPTTASNETTQLILSWIEMGLELDQFTNGMRPNATARALAYIQMVGYETAVADMDGYTSITSQLDGLSIDFDERDDDVDLNLALNTAYAEAYDHFMFNVSPNARGMLLDFRSEKGEELEEGLSNDEIRASRDWGRHVARRVIRYSQTDREAEAQIIDQTPEDYVAPVGAGLWTPDEGEVAWFPYWGEVRTFVISPEETSSEAPPFAHSTDPGSDYYAEMTEVNTIATTAREDQNEDLWIAEFWADDVEGLMMSPPGRQFAIAGQLIAQADLGFAATLELFLRLGLATNDACVSAWDDKYTYNTERPSTYIHEYINADFETNLQRLVIVPNPSFPGYPSGHATFAGAAAGVFAEFFGSDAINFTDRTHEDRTEFNGTPRSFTSFLEMALENGYSRVPLGVHVQADSDEGIQLGYEIAAAVNGMQLQN